MHTLKHKQRHTHKQKGTCSYTKSILYNCQKMEFRNNKHLNSRKTNAACCQSSIVSPGSSKTTPNILKVGSRVPQIQKKLTLTNQKHNLSHVQSTCSSKTPRTLTTIFEVGGRGEAYKYIICIRTYSACVPGPFPT